MDVRRLEIEGLAGAVAATTRRAAHRQTLLDQLPRHDRDGPAGEVVVVEPGVVAIHPGDDPDVHVIVAPELGEVAVLGIEIDEVSPRGWIGRDLSDQPAKCRQIEVALESAWRGHAATSASESSRAELRARSATCTASPNGGSAAGSTGRSDPYTSASTPSSRMTASTARAPYEEVSRKTSRSATGCPPRASSRSRCSGPRPASIAKHTRNCGCAGRPKTAKAFQAAFNAATYRVAAGHQEGTAVDSWPIPRAERVSSAGTQAPTKPSSSSAARPARSGSPRHGAAQAPNSVGSAAAPACHASSSGRAASGGSASIPSGLESATKARSSPSARTRAARASGSWSARSTSASGSPGTSATQASRRRRRRGASRRRASSATSGSGQRCWWTSICTLLLKVSVNRLSSMTIMRPPGSRFKPWMGARAHSRGPSGRRVPWREVPERQKRRATIRELAEKTGLSTAAVSYALRGMHVSAETEERVREAAEELGYEADPIARALRGGATAVVGLLVGSLADFWNQELVRAVQRELHVAD